MQEQHMKKGKTPTRKEALLNHSDSKPRKGSHRDLKPQTMQTLASTQIDSKNIPKEAKTQAKCPKAYIDSESLWTEDDQAQLISLLRKKGPQWEQFSSSFHKRQREEIKRHCLTILKNVIEKMISSRNRKGELNPKIMFRNLRTLIEDMRQGKLAKGAQVQEYRELIANMLLYNHQHKEHKDRNQSQCSQQVQELNQLLREFRKIIKKKGSRTSPSALLSQSQNNSQRGYSSDCSSFFNEQIPEDNQSEAVNKPEIQEEDEPSSEGNQKKTIILEEESLIKELLLKEGLLEYEQSYSMSGNRSRQICFSGDELRNESYQHFYQKEELESGCSWKISFTKEESQQ